MMANTTKPRRSFQEALQVVGALSQSGTVLVACSVLDAELERALKVTMRPMNREMYGRLFHGYGPLSSFSSKIDLAYAFGLTTNGVQANLTIIKSIRNKFAHTADVLTLESAGVQPLYQKLEKPAEPKENSTVGIFIECVDEIVSFLEEYLKSEGVTDDLSRRAHITLAEQL
jgi:hypothetical protein